MKRNKFISVCLTAALLLSPTALLSGCVGGPVGVASESSSSDSQTSVDSVTDSGGDTSDTEVKAEEFGLTDNIKDGVILHAWSWSFNTIKESMADIAAAGYSTIQTSPANAVDDGGGGMQLMGKGKWYYQYQPTNWTIGNYQVGTEEEFKAMCEEADKYGIKIVVDVVPNHTAADKSKVEQSFIDAVGGEDQLYHKNSNKDITSYSDRIQCTTYSLTGLHDVNTENPKFQDYFIQYINKLIEDGADGFRYDTAKHIALPDDPQEDPSLPNNFWDRVTTEITNADSIFNYGEVLQGDNERIEAYIEKIGRTTASSYGAALRGAVNRGVLKADVLSDFMVGGSSNVVTWVESHDNYTGGESLNMTDDKLILGWAVIAANGEGTPLFYDRPYGSSPDNQWGTMNRIGAAGSDLYKDKTVGALNHFRNAMAGETTEMSNAGEDTGVLLISRGQKGAVLINASEEDKDISIDTKLADGAYSDRGTQNGDFTVSGGKLTGKLSAGTVAVLYNDGYTEPVEMPQVSISANNFVISGDSVDVTLNVSGADGGKYTLNGSEADFSNGDSISVTSADNGEAVLKVSAANSSGYVSTVTYWFSQGQTVNKGSQISFLKPQSWGDKVYAYIYDETVSPVKENAPWPGVEMTPSEDDDEVKYAIKDDEGSNGEMNLSIRKYTYTTDEDWNNGLVIFNDGGTNQYPASMEPGAELKAGNVYSAGDGSVTVDLSGLESGTNDGITVNFTKPDSWDDDINIYVYQHGGSEKIAAWPGEPMTKNSDGTYSYVIKTDTVTDPRIVFNDGKNQYPVSDGLEAEEGKMYTVG